MKSRQAPLDALSTSAMGKVTLRLILEEVQKNTQRLDKIEAKNDDRFELIKQEFTSVRSDVNSLRSDVNSLDSGMKSLRLDMNTRFEQADQRFDRIDQDLKIIREQTGRTVEDVVDLKKRVIRIEDYHASR
jgi:chromosome segregation ATPase